MICRLRQLRTNGLTGEEGQAKFSRDNVFSVQPFTDLSQTFLLARFSTPHRQTPTPSQKKILSQAQESLKVGKKCGDEDHFRVKGNHRKCFAGAYFIEEASCALPVCWPSRRAINSAGWLRLKVTFHSLLPLANVYWCACGAGVLNKISSTYLQGCFQLRSHWVTSAVYFNS